ncbi:Copia protein [Eumeta japonica]|uniref:Copia protein n=1 Tax=Eumeta variegata TaxID=151549 RepID=A0A4C1WV46_EUMVA|nr:Copia protein [Eumeta japonica]
MEITKTKQGLEIKQTRILRNILSKFNIKDCKCISTPTEIDLDIDEKAEIVDVPFRELMGLMCMAIITRPDIAFAICFLCRYLNKPTAALWKAGKGILRCLKNTMHIALVYKKVAYNLLQGYSDADSTGDRRDLILSRSSKTPRQTSYRKATGIGCRANRFTDFIFQWNRKRMLSTPKPTSESLAVKGWFGVETRLEGSLENL